MSYFEMFLLGGMCFSVAGVGVLFLILFSGVLATSSSVQMLRQDFHTIDEKLAHNDRAITSLFFVRKNAVKAAKTKKKGAKNGVQKRRA